MTWEDRAREALRLAVHVGDAGVDARLLALLLDAQNTAVSGEATDALLARRDLPGLALVVEAFGEADEDTRNKMGDCLYDESGERWRWVKEALGLLDGDPAVSASGVVALRAHMDEQAQNDSR